MIQKLIVIIAGVGIYIHILSSTSHTNIKDVAIKTYQYCEDYLKKMNIEIEVNKLPSNSPKK